MVIKKVNLDGKLESKHYIQMFLSFNILDAQRGGRGRSAKIYIKTYISVIASEVKFYTIQRITI